MEEPGLISVRTEVVLDVLIGSMAGAVAARMADELPTGVEAALLRAPALAGPEGAAPGGAVRVARAGWHAREVEHARFERAREPDLATAALLADADTCAALAAKEPLERPRPDDPDAMTWRVPGPGGHVRHFLAERAVADHAGVGAGAGLKRCWVYGFLLASAPPGAIR